MTSRRRRDMFLGHGTHHMNLPRIVHSLQSMTIAAMFLSLQGLQTLSAQLPMMQKQPWLGYFAVADESKFRFQIATTGEVGFYVLNKGGDPVEAYPITLQFLATETLPDGSVRDLPMKLDTPESTDSPTAKLKKTVFRGKLTEQATGQPTLEVTIENSNGSILASARITDKGAFDKNPLLPVIRVVFPGFYAPEQAARETWDKKQTKDFDKVLRKDSVSLKHLDGKTVKLACVEKPELKPDEINAAGSSQVEVDIAAYQNRKIALQAATNSSLSLVNASPAPLHSGFCFQWSADAAKDPDGKAKLAIMIK